MQFFADLQFQYRNQYPKYRNWYRHAIRRAAPARDRCGPERAAARTLRPVSQRPGSCEGRDGALELSRSVVARPPRALRIMAPPNGASASIWPGAFHSARLRRTVATHLTRDERCHRVVLERILNHTDRSVTGRFDESDRERLRAAPAGKLSLAVGAMYKRDEYSYRADSISTVFLVDGDPDIQGFLPTDDINDSDHNTDICVEASIPLLANCPGAQSLETVLGYRRSEYASAGSADAWKAELLYRPNDTLCCCAARCSGRFERPVCLSCICRACPPRISPMKSPIPARSTTRTATVRMQLCSGRLFHGGERRQHAASAGRCTHRDGRLRSEPCIRGSAAVAPCR